MHGDDEVNCLCDHIHWVESYVHAYMTDGDRLMSKM